MLEASAAEIRFGRRALLLAPHALRVYGFLELARDSAEALLPKETVRRTRASRRQRRSTIRYSPNGMRDLRE